MANITIFNSDRDNIYLTTDIGITTKMTKKTFREGFIHQPKIFNKLKFNFITWIKLMRNDNSN